MRGPEIVFILYRPAVPGNIGAAARAIKTMGFERMRLVEPADHLSDEARMLAHGSHDVLEQSKVYSSFPDAVADIDFIVCTTAKKKSAKVDYISSQDLGHFLSEKIPVARRIGIVFGTEESGLPNSILLLANVGVTIPMATTHPSLNLAQSVMVIAYELSALLRSIENGREDGSGGSGKSGFGSDGSGLGPRGTEQQPEAWQQLQDRTSGILQQSGIRPGTPLYHRIMERLSFLKASDARLAHSVTSKVKELIDRLSQK